MMKTMALGGQNWNRRSSANYLPVSCREYSTACACRKLQSCHFEVEPCILAVFLLIPASNRRDIDGFFPPSASRIARALWFITGGLVIRAAIAATGDGLDLCAVHRRANRTPRLIRP